MLVYFSSGSEWWSPPPPPKTLKCCFCKYIHFFILLSLMVVVFFLHGDESIYRPLWPAHGDGSTEMTLFVKGPQRSVTKTLWNSHCLLGSKNCTARRFWSGVQSGLPFKPFSGGLNTMRSTDWHLQLWWNCINLPPTMYCLYFITCLLWLPCSQSCVFTIFGWVRFQLLFCCHLNIQ